MREFHDGVSIGENGSIRTDDCISEMATIAEADDSTRQDETALWPIFMKALNLLRYLGIAGKNSPWPPYLGVWRQSLRE